MKALAFLLLMTIGTFGSADELHPDIDCLRSIKDSLQDPLNRLSSWKFDGSSICRFRGIECWHPDEEKILNIKLNGMGLMGEFPRGIAGCKSITGLDLSRNNLYGSIPADICRNISFLTTIDLSFNRFSGRIPSGFANCSYLNVIKLNNNLLKGNIPNELGLLLRLRSFSVANNHLSGPVPKFLNSDFPVESYELNPGLCDPPLDACGPSSKSLKNDFIHGFLISWVVFFLVTLLMAYYKPFGKFTKKFKKTTPRIESLSSRNRANHNDKISELEKFVPSMILDELRRATDGFSQNHVIERGEDRTVYKAFLKNGWSLTIKRLHQHHPEQEFLSEITTLGRLKHDNLAPLTGFCHELNERMLIYKFAPIGSLYDCLFSSNGKSVVLEWPTKVKIAVGIAKGIAWFHTNGVVHRGINTKCVLLDQSLDPKILDVGRATPIVPNHTNYSWNREFVVPGCYIEDVYGFGVVLLELITGKEHSDLMESFEGIDGNLVDVVSHLLNTRRGEPELEHDETAFHFLRVAGKCIECEPGEWPSMVDVLQMMIGIRTSTADGSGITLLNNEIQLIGRVKKISGGCKIS